MDLGGNRNRIVPQIRLCDPYFGHHRGDEGDGIGIVTIVAICHELTAICFLAVNLVAGEFGVHMSLFLARILSGLSLLWGEVPEIHSGTVTRSFRPHHAAISALEVHERSKISEETFGAILFGIAAGAGAHVALFLAKKLSELFLDPMSAKILPCACVRSLRWNREERR